MLNFRFHIVSLVAVFLALAIGIIMGSTVIDRALVDTLEDQQERLRGDLDDLRAESSALRDELSALRDTSDRLADEGGQRLLEGTLEDVPVARIAVRGVDGSALDALDELFARAGAEDLGTLWLTGRFALEDEEAVEDLREVLGLPGGTPGGLRSAALQEVADAIRATLEAEEAADAAVVGGATTPTPQEDAAGPDADLDVLVELRDAGFLDYDAGEGQPDDITRLVGPGMRVVLVSGPGAEVPDEDLAAPLARALVDRSIEVAPPVPVLAAELAPVDEGGEDVATLVERLRDDDVQDRLSTVDNLETFAGRLAAVIAVQDLGAGRRGHYGVGPGAERLVPAPQG